MRECSKCSVHADTLHTAAASQTVAAAPPLFPLNEADSPDLGREAAEPEPFDSGVALPSKVKSTVGHVTGGRSSAGQIT